MRVRYWLAAVVIVIAGLLLMLGRSMAAIGKRLGANFNCEPASFTIRRSNTRRSEPPSVLCSAMACHAASDFPDGRLGRGVHVEIAQLSKMAGMAGCYPGSYLDRCDGWRAAAILTPVKLHPLPHPRCWRPPSLSSVLQRGHSLAAHPTNIYIASNHSGSRSRRRSRCRGCFSICRTRGRLSGIAPRGSVVRNTRLSR
jgi:hypothetical protein